MQPLPFVKMHGLGNDFVVIDGRRAGLRLSPDQVRAIADRRCGVGCDQLIALLPPRRADGDAFMQIFNADGGEAESCGNAARCVARSLMTEAGRDHVVIETEGGELRAAAAGDEVSVDMGAGAAGVAGHPSGGRKRYLARADRGGSVERWRGRECR